MPIYVDCDVRNRVIPKAKQEVEKLIREVKKLDEYSQGNFYVEEVKIARAAESKSRECKANSFFSGRPQLQIAFKP